MLQALTMMKSQTRLRTGLWAVCALALGATTVAGHLAWSTWNSSPVVGCGEQSLFDCNAVITGKWSKWLGMPVSFMGAVTYGLLLGVSLVMSVWARARNSAWAWLCLSWLALLAAGAAIWFFVVQAFVLGEFCLYCCLVHSLGLVTCLVVLWILPRGDREEQQARMGRMFGFQSEASGQPAEFAPVVIGTGQLLGVSLAAVVGWGALILGQWFAADESFLVEMTTQETTASEAVVPTSLPGGSVEADEGFPEAAMEFVPAEKAESSATSTPRLPTVATPTEGRLTGEQAPSPIPVRRQPVMIGGMLVDVSKLPLKGNPQAKHLMVELVDYTCLHCRHLHHMLTGVMQRYGDQVAIVLRLVALSPKCNPYIQGKNRVHAEACEYSKLSLAVWRMDPEKFPEFHDWLMGSEKIPSISVAKKRAVRLVGVDVLLREIHGKAVREMLDQNNLIFHGTKRGLPILITTVGSLSGVPKSAEQLYEVFEKHLRMHPVSQSELKEQVATESRGAVAEVSQEGAADQ